MSETENQEGVAYACQQGDRIKGYKKLSEEQLALFNEGKELALVVGEYVKKVEALKDHDPRWAAIGKTGLQQSFMSLYRAITKPDGF